MDSKRSMLFSQLPPMNLEELLNRRREKEQEWERQQQERMRLQEEEDRKQRLLQQRLYKNHILFMETEGLYVFDPNGSISSRELYELYKTWCIREELPIKPPREFWLYLKEAAPRYRLTYSGNIIDSRGKRCRGFRGIRAVTQNTDNSDISI